MAMLFSVMSFAQESWLLVTDASTLTTEDEVVIVAKDYAVAMSTTQNNNNRGQVAITKDGNAVTINATTQVLTLKTGTKANTFALSTGAGYLYAASSSSNHLKTQGTVSDNSSWKITIAANGTATLVAQGTNTRSTMQYNQQSSLFSCYSGATQKAITLYKKTSTAGMVKAPNIEGTTTFTSTTTVTITAEEGLEVYYTLDGTDPVAKTSTKYSAPFELSETAAVKAIAYDAEADKASSITTTNFTKIPVVTCAEAAALAKDEIAVLNPFDVVYVVKGTGNIYVKDETGAFLIYDYDLDDKLKAGDHVEGFIGISSPYNGLPEMKVYDASNLTITPGTAPEPTVMAAAPTTAELNQYVKFENVTLTADAAFTTDGATNATMVVNGTNVTLRNNFKLAATLSKDKAYNIVGFVAIYNSNIQVYFLSAEELVVNHTINVSANPAEAGTVTGGGEYEETDEITVKAVANEGYEFVCWTEGADTVSTDANYSFEVLADRNLVANFIKKTISYELNGGEIPAVVVPTNAELWGTDTADVNGFMHYYNHYYGLKRATQTIENVAAFAHAQMQQIMTDEASAYKWLGDYVQSVATAAGKPLSTDMAAANESGWRWSVWAFFNACAGKNGSAGIDFTEAGKPEAWGAAYQAAHAVVLPTEPVAAPYTLPTPVKEGYKFVGWYDNAEGTGEPMTVIPAGWDGTLYAIWVEIYTITVEAENGTVEGAGKYEHGAEATLTATAAEGYEFTCWTSGEDTVSTANPYKFTVTADVALVANFKEVVAEPTEVTVVVENMTKTIQSKGWMKQLTLDGEHETYGQVTLMASGCDGTYGTYAVIAWLGEDIELEGEGEWKNEGELDVLEVVVEDANGTVWNIIGKTDYVAPVEPVSMYADVEFTVDEEGILRVTGTTNDEVAVQLYVNGWNEVGYGTYGEGEVWGFIGDTEVANQQYTATIEQEGNVAYLHVILNDGEGNLYDLTAGGMALENPAAGAGSRTTVIVEEAEATVGIMFPEDLEIYGVSNDGREVLVTLWNGTVKKYGEYAEDFAVEVDWKQYDLVENTVATYSLEDGLAVFRAAVAAGKDTLDLVVSGTPWVDPATAEPTDTVTLAFTKGTINVSFDGTATIKGGNSDLGVQISTMGGDIYEGITSEQFNSYSSYLMIDWMQVKIYRGELKVVDLTNDVKVAYIGVLGADYKWYNITLTTADEIPTTLDNINATVAPAKRINNGQLIIIKNGVQYNAQGQVIK